MGTTLGVVPMVFDKFLIYLRFICKACTSTRISMRKVNGERVNTETAAFVSSWLLCRQHVCFWMNSDVHFCFSSLSFSLSSASPSFIVAHCSLSFAHCCFSRRRLAIQSFTSPSCLRCRLLSRFVVPSSASHSFTSACRHHHRPALVYFSFS